MTESLKVIALISGGKDSFFSLMHCIENGHQIVALANLYPPSAHALGTVADETDELVELKHDASDHDMDSYMYQTAGHGVVPLYADALGLPLYRQIITGRAVNSSKYYALQRKDSTGSEDETECLIPLLRMVIDAHPEANAVCSGAILSTYQRTRIESIALRLGLTPLSFLWQYPALPPPSPGGLLDDMAAVGLDVRIVKVASGGLDENLLCQNLMESSVRRKIQKAMARFGGSVLGEGGEYETLVVDGPSPVWKRRIDIDQLQSRASTQRISGGVALLSLPSDFKETCSKAPDLYRAPLISPRQIPLWDKQFEKLKIQRSQMLHDSNADGILPPQGNDQSWTMRPHQEMLGSLHFLSNLAGDPQHGVARAQMGSMNESIRKILIRMGRSTNDIVFTTLILESIEDDFATVNKIYEELFTQPNPPARVTVAAPLPKGVKVFMSLIIDQGSEDLRNGLHVQSRSYWAPANIGPYSQAIGLPYGLCTSFVYVAGQIPLIPATMRPLELASVEKNGNLARNEFLRFRYRACLSLQHLWRIGIERKVRFWTGTIAYLARSSNAHTKAILAHESWSEVHRPSLWTVDVEEEDGLDAWDKMYGGLGSLAGEIEPHQTIPDYSKLLPDSASPLIPGFFAVQVIELPRGCDIEWESLGVAQGEVGYSTAVFTDAMAITCNIPSANMDITYISMIKRQHSGSETKVNDRINYVRDHVLVRLGDPSSYLLTVYAPLSDIVVDLAARIVPCIKVWGSTEQGVAELDAGVVLQSAR